MWMGLAKPRSGSLAELVFGWAMVGCCTLCVGSYLGPRSAWTQTLQTLAPEGYVDLEGLWDSPANIPVCWEAASEPSAQEKGWVKDAVLTHISDVSSVRFRDWKDCPAQLIGIRITIADRNPLSDVGRQWSRDANGVKQQDKSGQWIQLPTRMVLNFTFGFHPAFRDRCQPDREHCIRAIAVHEFLHAIGFLHEQLRDNAPDECKRKFAHVADFPGFQPQYATQDYDPDSHMNYCANMYRKPMRLSAGDLFVLARFYPRP
jgi:hypothetical protein